MRTDASTSRAVVRSESRAAAVLILRTPVLMAGRPCKTFGRSLTSSGGVTFASIKSNAGPMLDLAFECPGGTLAVSTLGAREPIARSVMDLAEFGGTLSFGDERGHSLDETGRLRPDGGTRVLLDVQPILTTRVLKTGEGKEETVVQASPAEVVVARPCRRFGWETK